MRYPHQRTESTRVAAHGALRVQIKDAEAAGNVNLARRLRTSLACMMWVTKQFREHGRFGGIW